MEDKKSVVIAGGTGLVGSYLVKELDSKGFKIYVLTRSPKKSEGNIQYVHWDPVQTYIDPSLEKADFIINLAGEGIADKRWTNQRKTALLKSRVQSATTLQKWIQNKGFTPELYLGASAIGYYGDKGNEILTEDSAPGHDFLSTICQSWEEASQKISPLVDRTVILRLGIVLSMKGGALPKMLMTRHVGFLSYFGNGKQYYPWIHIQDLCQIMVTCIQNSSYKGIYNAVAPQEITNKRCMTDVKKILPNIFLVLPVPAIFLKLLLGEMSEALLNSHRVVPKRLIENGFSFSYVDFGQAVKELARSD